MIHDGMPYGRNQGQGQGHSREVDCQSPTGLIFMEVISREFWVGLAWELLYADNLVVTADSK